MIKKLWVLLSLLLISALMAIPLSACSSSAPLTSTAKYKWRFQVAFPESDGSFVLGQGVKKIIEEASNGQIAVEIYPAGALVAPEEQLSATIDGSIDMSYNMSPADAELVPAALTASLPGAGKTLDEQFDLLYNMGVFKNIQADYESKGLHLLINPLAGREMLRSTFNFTGWDSFKGKKGWANPVTVNILTQLGGVCVDVPGFDMYSAMKLGTIEWHAWTISEFETTGLKEVTKSAVLDPPTLLAADAVVINPKAWQSIGPDLQNKIEDQLIKNVKSLGQAYWDRDNSAIAAAEKYGVTFLKMSDSDAVKYQNLCVKEWDNFAAEGPWAAKNIVIGKEFLKKVGRN
jgi:TRAP-type C4-dicarboxylate transport system substrate-binding protein